MVNSPVLQAQGRGGSVAGRIISQFTSKPQLQQGLKPFPSLTPEGRSSETREATWSHMSPCHTAAGWAGVQGSPRGYRDLRLNPFWPTKCPGGCQTFSNRVQTPKTRTKFRKKHNTGISGRWQGKIGFWPPHQHQPSPQHQKKPRSVDKVRKAGVQRGQTITLMFLIQLTLWAEKMAEGIPLNMLAIVLWASELEKMWFH